MNGLGKNVGAELLSRGVLAAAAAGSAVTGLAVDTTALGARASSVRAVLAIRGNLDSGDTLIVSAIKLQSSADSAFTTPVDEVTAANVTLTGASAVSDADYFSQATLDLDLGQVPSTRKYLRLIATPTLSDTTNTTGAIGGVFEFGGISEAPAA